MPLRGSLGGEIQEHLLEVHAESSGDRHSQGDKADHNATTPFT